MTITNARPYPQLTAKQQERLNAIPCPVLRSLVNEGRLTPDAEGRVELRQLDDALRALGISGLPRKALVKGAEGQGKEQVAKLLSTLTSSQFNVLQLRGGSLDHAGDTRILRDSFDPARLDWLASFATDGKRLTLDDVARAQKAARTEEPAGVRGAFLGVAELAAIVVVFGTPDANGKKGLALDDLRSLYQDAKIPAGFEPQKTGAMELIGALAKVAFTQAFTPAGRAQMGIDKAVGRDEQLDRTAAKGLQAALCPAGMRPATKPAPLNAKEAALLHGA